MLTTVVVRVLHGREEAISNGLSDKENRMYVVWRVQKDLEVFKKARYVS